METTPEHHVITSGGLRPLEARRVNAVSLKVARGPLRAISRLGSARSDIFFSLSFSLVEQARKLRSREKESPPPVLLSLYLAFPAFSSCAAIYGVRTVLIALSSRSERNRMRYIASRNYLCFFVNPHRRKKKWKLLVYGERSSETTTTAMLATTLVGQSRSIALEWKEQRRRPEKG